MSPQTDSPPPPPAGPGPAPGGLVVTLALAAVTMACLVVLFQSGLERMWARYASDEYNHGYLIPFVALYLLWLKSRDLGEARLRGSWLGVGLVVASLALLTLGDLSAVFTLTQMAFIVALWGVALAAAGTGGMRYLWVPLLYLVFLVPLPNFIENRLTASLQLLSSEIGVAVIRAAGLTVYLEGNVIDLYDYKLQVAEACSGMRYLFPLMSFGFLCAVLFRGPWWQRGLLVLTTIPITILMNSFRIGVIGILVNFYGIEQAEGFLHDFEGWVVFMACVAILFLIMWGFARLNRQPLLVAFGLDIPPVSDLTTFLSRARPNAPALTAIGLVVVAALASLAVDRPPMLAPERQPLAQFPLRLGDWEGREGYVEQVYIDVLRTSDHLIADYLRPADEAPVQLWIAWYDSQVSGASVHSPQSCIPGGGWQIESFTPIEIPDVSPDGGPLRVNRALIAMGDARQVVYYWFPQRGRQLTNEFLVKWYIFQDGLTMNRTDGALVRVSTYVPDVVDLPAAEARLVEFVRTVQPRLAYHIPDASAPPRTTLAATGS